MNREVASQNTFSFNMLFCASFYSQVDLKPSCGELNGLKLQPNKMINAITFVTVVNGLNYFRIEFEWLNHGLQRSITTTMCVSFEMDCQLMSGKPCSPSFEIVFSLEKR